MGHIEDQSLASLCLLGMQPIQFHLDSMGVALPMILKTLTPKRSDETTLPSVT